MTKLYYRLMVRMLLPVMVMVSVWSCKGTIDFPPLDENESIVFIGNTFSEGFQRHNYFETLLYHNYPDHNLKVRNLSWSSDEVGLRPRPLNFPSLDSLLTSLQADVVFLSFGLNESYQGEAGLAAFKGNLEAFILTMQEQKYNSESAPQLILISPVAYEQLDSHLPLEDPINANLEMYTNAMEEVARAQEVNFIDLYHPVRQWMEQSDNPLTSNGIHLNDQGRIRVAEFLADKLGFPTHSWSGDGSVENLRRIIREKNRHFFYTYRPSNSEYIIGRRKDWPGGQALHEEIRETGEIVSRLDSLIWAYSGSYEESTFQQLDGIIDYGPGRPVTLADRTEYAPDKSQFIIKEGYEIELFASEQNFPIGNPVTMTFDARGRLWLSTMPSYPNYYPGDPPNDQIITLEDVDQDGKADTHTVFADSLYLPLGFELDGQGVYVTEAPDFLYLQDTTGDDVADTRDYVLHGFGTEDAHHSLSNYTWGPDGALYMHMGTFLHTQIETPYGPRRGAYGTTWRYDPRRQKLDNYISYPYANPWGNVFNQYGDHFIADASTGRCHFGTPLSTYIDFPHKHTSQPGFLTAEFAPKTCGMEIISSTNFPDEVQGDILLNTFVGFQGIRQHQMILDSSAYLGNEVPPLLQSKDPNFRPVDLKFGPDGALYVLDWFNPIVQHGEQGFREELRDHAHGRIWRITYSSRPTSPVVDYSAMSVSELLESLENTVDREKYRLRRQIGTFPDEDIITGLNQWLDGLDATDGNGELCRLEALWMYQRIDHYNPELLMEVLGSNDEQIRAAAVKVMLNWRNHVADYEQKLMELAEDPSFKVRLEVAVAWSHEKSQSGIRGLLKIREMPVDEHIEYVLRQALMNLQPVWIALFESDPEFLADQADDAYFLFDLLEDSVLTSAHAFIHGDPDWLIYSWQKPTEEVYSRLDNSSAFRAYHARFGNEDSKVVEDASDDQLIARITLKAVPGKMDYDKDTLRVRAGQEVRIEFENEDAMAHNIVVVNAGHKEEIGQLADQMAMESDGYERSFIPESEHILFYTLLVNAGEAYTMEFTAPAEKGIYPFICTFPGHWRIMQGVLVVE